MKDVDIYSQMMQDNLPLYLKSPNNLEGFIEGPREQKKELKTKALDEFKQDLQEADTVDAVFQLYNKIKNRTDSVLRYHIDNIIYDFGDTDSYKNAVEACYNRIVDGDMLTDFAAYNAASIILEEMIRCKIKVKSNTHLLNETMDAKDVLRSFKEKAKKKFLEELHTKTTAKEVLGYFDIASASNCILQRHFDNILFKHGATNTYVEVILVVARNVCQFKDFSKEDVKKIQQLHDELNRISYFLGGSEFKEIIPQLKQIIDWEVVERPTSEKKEEFSRNSLTQP